MCLMYDSALSQVEQSKNMECFVKSIVKAQQQDYNFNLTNKISIERLFLMLSFHFHFLKS